MSSVEREELPLACSLTEAELRVRGGENASLFARASGVEELADGYRFIFPASDEDAKDVLGFILAERACCPFFTFELAFASPHEAIQLTIRGSEGVKEIVRTSSALAAVRHVGDAVGEAAAS
jgi:hypothetical protein